MEGSHSAIWSASELAMVLGGTGRVKVMSEAFGTSPRAPGLIVTVLAEADTLVTVAPLAIFVPATSMPASIPVTPGGEVKVMVVLDGQSAEVVAVTGVLVPDLVKVTYEPFGRSPRTPGRMVTLLAEADMLTTVAPLAMFVPAASMPTWIPATPGGAIKLRVELDGQSTEVLASTGATVALKVMLVFCGTSTPVLSVTFVVTTPPAVVTATAVTVAPAGMPLPLTGIPTPTPMPGALFAKVRVDPDRASSSVLTVKEGMTKPCVKASRSIAR